MVRMGTGRELAMSIERVLVVVVLVLLVVFLAVRVL
jgi:hypothetical protein